MEWRSYDDEEDKFELVGRFMTKRLDVATLNSSGEVSKLNLFQEEQEIWDFDLDGKNSGLNFGQR